MAEVLDAVITAGGRLAPEDAARFGTDVKALVRIGGATLLATAIAAARGLPEVDRITVVGPRAARDVEVQPDAWIDEFETGEENLFAALGSARTRRALFCASDLPFVSAHAIAGLLSMVRQGVCVAYPVYDRATFLRAYPGGRQTFFKLADGEWTGGSVMLLEPSVLRERTSIVRQIFAARKEPATLTKLLGFQLSLRFMAGRARVADLEARAAQLLRKPVAAVRGADPALAMDCDDTQDFEYAIARLESGRHPTRVSE